MEEKRYCPFKFENGVENNCKEECALRIEKKCSIFLIAAHLNNIRDKLEAHLIK